MTNASLYGAKYAGKAGTALGSFAGLKSNHAAMIGKRAYQGWLYGLPLLDVALGVKKTIQEGIKDMHELQAQAQPLLSASDDKHIGIGKALTSNYTVLAHARAKAWAHFRQNLAGTVAGTVRALPAIVMGYNKAKLDDIVHPERALDMKAKPDFTAAEKEVLANKKGIPEGEMPELKAKLARDGKERSAIINERQEKQMPAGQMQNCAKILLQKLQNISAPM